MRQAAAASLAFCLGIDHPTGRRIFVNAIVTRVCDRYDDERFN